MSHLLETLPARFRTGEAIGIPSVCSAHTEVIAAALELAKERGEPALIEATCNQVNQEGGYTGMTPADFRALVFDIAGRVGFPPERLILGGDHLGPNPWRHLPAADAMARARVMVAAYAAAGFTKLHLDTSMGCLGEPVALADELTAERAADLAQVVEAHRGDVPPVYIIGTEVPVPGGAAHDIDTLEVTRPSSVEITVEVHRRAFRARGLDDAFSRVIGLVVQPGVEFSHDSVVPFAPDKARALSATLRRFPQFVFEAHSTDYQSEAALDALVRQGFAILKVGPGLTFALREALYGLDAVADALDGMPPQGRLMRAMEGVMLDKPGHWDRYYHGDISATFLQRHFSYSDRIRYYWPEPAARSAVARLAARLDGRAIPETLLSQYVPSLACHGGASGLQPLLRSAVKRVLQSYDIACHPSQ